MKFVKEKTSLQLSRPLVLQAEEMGNLLGVGKGDMVSMGLAFLLVSLSPLQKVTRKRRQMLKEVERQFQMLMSNVEESPIYRG